MYFLSANGDVYMYVCKTFFTFDIQYVYKIGYN